MRFLIVVSLCFGVIECAFPGQKRLNNGMWNVVSVEECPDPDKYPSDFTLSRRKINRTHDAFSVKVNLTETITASSHAVYAELCRKMDGGCKPEIIFEDESFCNTANKRFEANFRAILKEIGLEDCPIPEGKYEIIDYVFNYEELPDNGVFGEFITTVYLIKDGIKVVCFKLGAVFDESNDADD